MFNPNGVFVSLFSSPEVFNKRIEIIDGKMINIESLYSLGVRWIVLNNHDRVSGLSLGSLSVNYKVVIVSGYYSILFLWV